MHVARRITTALLAAALAVVAAGLLLRIYLGRPAEDRLAPEEAVNLAELRPPLARPSFLACPPGYCSAADMTSPVFDMSWHRLREFWIEMIGAERPMVRVVADVEHRRFVYIQHSQLFRFPDIVTVEFVPLGPERSSIAIYSRSRYGGRDFAKNRKRVQRWLVLLQKVGQPAVPSHGRRP